VAKPLRVVFDSNVFTPDGFDILDNSHMRQRCKERYIIPVYGSTFLEETYKAYKIKGKREDLVKRWMPFIADTVERYCTDYLTIWHRELVQGRGVHADIYMTRQDQAKLSQRFRNIPLDGSWPAWVRAQPQITVEEAKRAAQHETSRDVREEFSRWRKRTGYNTKKHGVVKFGQYAAGERDFAGRAFLIANVKCVRPHAVADRWAKYWWMYPYFTSFVNNMLYIAHHAMIKNNDKIDLNAQADLDVMTHLLRADALVSNEKGFLKTAFDDLWRPKKKILFTTEQFCNYLE